MLLITLGLYLLIGLVAVLINNICWYFTASDKEVKYHIEEFKKLKNDVYLHYDLAFESHVIFGFILSMIIIGAALAWPLIFLKRYQS